MADEQCPNCGSDNITVEGRGIHPKFDFNKQDEISALKFNNASDISMLQVKCQSCESELKPTRGGYRLSNS